MERQGIKILVIDDEFENNEIINAYLLPEGYTVIATTDTEKALDFINNDSFDIAIVDIHMPIISGLDIIKHIKENTHQTEVIVLTADTTVSTAVEAMKLGASDYITKPFTQEKIIEIVNRVAKKIINKKNITIENKGSSRFGIIGESPKMQGIFNLIEKASQTMATILISGESGTGKELVARAIHYSSKNKSSSFIPVNCGGIPESLIESELFGYAKGAFTGANENRQGFFQTANNGTILLDEVGEMSLNMQVKLLRVLQEKQFYMIGSRTPIQINLRIIAVTNKNLRTLIENNLFREDLYYRLHVISIELPPLRERQDDILLLINYFLNKYSKEFEKPVPQISNNAFYALQKYKWPGNVRELENVIQMLVTMNDDTIDINDLPEYMRYSALKGIAINKTLEEVEKEYMQRVLISVKGNKTQAAKILGIDRKTLWDKLKHINK
ncbi:MAG: sigma-54-dependent Fis family transcriptional regulator [Spirochaetales bacterium]|nr:sigma-54-dependent Fis family transcriptional regulator [Spirochaetales bacterium]